MIKKKRPPGRLSESSIKRVWNGKTAVEQGRKFEDDVAELYRLLGAQVIRNIEVHHKKVDIFATFRIPGSSREHRIIVECKDEKRAIDANQRIMAFKGLLLVARESGVAESAEIVTRVPWSPQAKGFAKTAGIDLFTYTEKLSQLIDLTAYLRGLISRFDEGDPNRPTEPPQQAYYVDLSARRGAGKRAEFIPVIDTYIHQWLKNGKSERQLAIFGEYGSGKSSLCRKLARDLAISYLKEPNANRIPILLNLREFVGKLDLEAYVTSFLDRQCRVNNPRIELFRAMSEAGIFLLIFDGFDEMAVKVDADTLESNLLEIEKLAASPKSKILLTSRPEYFISAGEENEALTPALNPFLNRATRYEPLRIEPWDERRVELFLQRRVPLLKGAAQPWTRYRNKIRETGRLSDLSQRPVLLEMIVKTLPGLIAGGETINLPSLYKSYLTGEMKRQKVLKKRTLLLSDDDRLKLLRALAVRMYLQATPSITFMDAQDRIETDIGPPKHELEAHTRDFLANSFLVRRGDEYSLSHKSIMEYLLAAKLHEEIQSDNPELFGRLFFELAILNFLKEFPINRNTLLRWIELTRAGGCTPDAFLGSNAATLLCSMSNDALAGRDLSGTNLTGANLKSADLRDTKLHKTILSNAYLDGAKFFRKDFISAKIDGISVSFYVPEEKAGMMGRKVLEVMNKESAKYSARGDRLWGIRPAISGGLLWECIFKVRSLGSLEKLKRMLSRCLSAQVAVYFDEYEQLVSSLDSRHAGPE